MRLRGACGHRVGRSREFCGEGTYIKVAGSFGGRFT